MILRVPDSDHNFSKKLDGQQAQQQQQQWQRVNKSNNKKPINNKFTTLLDKHFESKSYNYFAPLSLSSNPLINISSSFPAIMPTLTLTSSAVKATTSDTLSSASSSITKLKKQSNIDTFYGKTIHTGKGSSNGKNSGSDESRKKSPSKATTEINSDRPTSSPMQKSGSPSKQASSLSLASPSKQATVNNSSATRTILFDNEAHDSEKATSVANRSSKRISNRSKPSYVPSKDNSYGNESDAEDDSVFGKEEWSMPEADGNYTSDTSDSDAKISQVIDNVTVKRNYRKGGRGSGRGHRDCGRGRGRGRGGGLSSDRDSDFSRSQTNKADSDTNGEYTEEEAGVVPVANGAKRRKSVAHHRKLRDQLMDDNDSESQKDFGRKGNELDENQNIEKKEDSEMHHADTNNSTASDVGHGAAESTETVVNEDAGTSEGEKDGNDSTDDEQDDADEDSDVMNATGNEDNDAPANNNDNEDGSDDSGTGADDSDDDSKSFVNNASLIPTFDMKWLFEFHPTEKVERFKIDSIIGCLATALRSVDATAYIAAWDDDTPAQIFSKETVPKTDDDMKFFVEDPHTSSAGTFGRLYGRIRVLSSITLADFKLNPEFGAWIRTQGLFLDTSEIPSTRPKLIGFFDRKLPHTSRIDIFIRYLQSTTNISKPFQLFSQTINAGDKTDLKCYAYVLKADYKDSATILKELALSKNSSVKFYPWEDFRDHTDLADKRKIISDMTDYARNHASFVFHGVKSNEYMRLKHDKRSKSHKVQHEKQLSSLQQAYTEEENQKDNAFSNVKCLDYMQQIFVDSDRQPIFKRIDGPYNDKIEVTFEKAYFNKVRDIEKRFIHILSSKMTDISCSKCFNPWPIPLTPDSMTTLWLPPKAFKRSGINLQNPYKKPGTTIEFLLTSTSTMSYKDASTSGRRQIDIPMTLVDPVPNTSTPVRTANSTTTTLTSTKDSSILAELQTAQTAFQTEYDSRLAKLDATIARVEAESKLLQKSLAALSIEVATNYTEIQTSQRKSETRITRALAKQSTLQKKAAAKNQRMMAKILQKLGGDDTENADSDDEDLPNDDDTIMTHSPEHPDPQPNGSSRTNHPKDKNIKNIQPSSRNKSRVAAVVN